MKLTEEQIDKILDAYSAHWWDARPYEGEVQLEDNLFAWLDGTECNFVYCKDQLGEDDYIRCDNLHNVNAQLKELEEELEEEDSRDAAAHADTNAMLDRWLRTQGNLI